MTAAQHERVDALFNDLFDLSPEARATALAAEPDPEVRAEAASLLQHAGLPTEALRAPIGDLIADAGATGAFDDRTIGPGTRFERYRIERKIGHGGMGDVYEATRDNDFHKRVALKIVRYGLDSEFARGRFQQERQTLAGLEHPYIARLLDGGEGANGCPFLVLEFVDGVPIDAYCEGHTKDEILCLFLKVCEAVEYAHRNLVIHRDLKPGNILVTADGTPKLLDFGIAKLLDPTADVTLTKVLALTPQYASPEQVLGAPITTASDVYSLGVILYQLLTGRKPYHLDTSTAIELERTICITPPAPPQLGNELDHILLMALRKEPERRYPSVLELSQDIQRYQEGRAVYAAPDSFRYRASKFIRRHLLPLAAIAIVLIAVTASAGVAWRQARIARGRFDQVRSLAHSFVFDYGDDLAKVQGNTAVRERMVSTALQYLDNLSRSASNDLDLQKELASAYQKIGDTQGFPTRPNLGHTDAALASYRKSAAIGESIAARDPSYRFDLGRFYANFSLFLLRTGDLQGARNISALAFQNLDQAARTYPKGGNALELASAWCILGDIDEDSAHESSALRSFRRCDELAQETLARGRSMDALQIAQGAKDRLGTATLASGHIREALDIFDQDQVLIEEALRSEPSNPIHLRSLALVNQYRAEAWFDDIFPNLDNPAESLKYARESLEATRKRVAADPEDAAARFSLAVALFRLSFPLQRLDPAAAVKNAQESVGIFDSLLAAGKRTYLVRSRRNRAVRRLAEALLAAGRFAESAERADEGLASQRTLVASSVGESDEATVLSLLLLVRGKAAAALHDLPTALRCLTEAEHTTAMRSAQGPDELEIAVPLSAIREELALQSAASGQPQQAKAWLQAALAMWNGFSDQNDFVRRQISILQKQVGDSPGKAPAHQ